MTQDVALIVEQLLRTECISQGEQDELLKIGMISPEFKVVPAPKPPAGRPVLHTRSVNSLDVLNEAFDYRPQASSFSRALAFEIGGHKVLLISGTASVDENGESVHINDFRAQCLRTFRNITSLLAAEDMTWHDIIRTSCYLRDIARDYNDFNEIRTAFYKWLELDPLPASTGIEAGICRSDLLVEIEAIAVAPLR